MTTPNHKPTLPPRPTTYDLRAKVLEIFKSIQGEGKYAGVSQVFVRFFECNMHCDWCDTPNSIGDGKREYTEYSVDALFAEVQKLWSNCHSVSITGGEPLMQSEFIKEFIVRLKESSMPVYLETNGILFKEFETVIDGVDIVSMDLKLPSSTKCQPYWKEHEEFLKVASRKDVFIKAVITSDTVQEDIQTSVELVRRVDPKITFYLQPNYFEMKNGVMEKCILFHEYCSKYLKDVRILPQTHKFMKLR